MCSPFRNRDVLRTAGIALLSASAVVGCNKASQTTVSQAPASATVAQGTPVSSLFPGNGSPPPPSEFAAKYADDDAAKAEGARLFDWYNCSGCHFHGAGGIGPSLMDNDWIYGSGVDQIYATIYQGRPNGMPSWGTKLSATEIWEIAAYVHSLPASNPSGAASLPTTPLPPVRDGDAVAPDQAAPSPKGTTE